MLKPKRFHTRFDKEWKVGKNDRRKGMSGNLARPIHSDSSLFLTSETEMLLLESRFIFYLFF